MDFLRELFNLNENMAPDLENMTDRQLMDLCRELGLEDSCVVDGEGGLANREEVIAEIQAANDMDEPHDNMTDAEADADTLASAGWGTDEDYGTFEGAMPQGVIRNKQRIANMTDEEKKARFKGVSKEKAAEMERRHCVKPGTYAKHCSVDEPEQVKESEEKEYRVFISFVKNTGRGADEQHWSRVFKASSPEAAKAKAKAHMDHTASLKGNRISKRSINIHKVELKEGVIPTMKHRGKPMTNVRSTFNFYKPVKNVVKENKTFDQAHEDKVGNAGMKGMKTKDRPYMTKMRFKDWLIGNTFSSKTCSGDLAGTMKLKEFAGDPKDFEPKKKPKKLVPKK